MIVVDKKMPTCCKECDFCDFTEATRSYPDIYICNATNDYERCDDGIENETRSKICPIKAEIPDDVINGDVIKALFSSIPPYDVTFDEKWWNAPYKGVGK